MSERILLQRRGLYVVCERSEVKETREKRCSKPTDDPQVIDHSQPTTSKQNAKDQEVKGIPNPAHRRCNNGR